MGAPLSASWVVAPIVVPLVGALLAWLLPWRRWTAFAWSTALAMALVVAGLAAQVQVRGASRYAIGAWGAPLGIDLYVDGLTLLMLIMTATVGAGVSVYAAAYFTPAIARAFWPLWLFLWAALNALFLSADIFNLYVTLELVTLASVALIALAGGSALSAAMRYLLAALLGSLAYLLGVALLYGNFGVLDIARLGRAMAPGPVPALAIGLMAAGLMLKSALFPLHYWLAPAHARAPAPVSAILSALVVKASVYMLLRLWLQAFPAALAPAAHTLLGVLGAAAILWGSYRALRAARLKRLVAYSTVAQVGYLFLLFPLLAASDGDPLAAWQGGVYHALSHAIAKAAMFLAAGTLLHALGDDRIDGLASAAHHFPLTLFAFGLAGVSIMGLPPSGGFVAKWLLLSAALSGGQWGWAMVIVTGGLLAAGYVFRVLRPAFQGHRERHPGWRPVSPALELSALGLAVLSVLLGFLAPLPLAAIGQPSATSMATP